MVVTTGLVRTSGNEWLFRHGDVDYRLVSDRQTKEIQLWTRHPHEAYGYVTAYPCPWFVNVLPTVRKVWQYVAGLVTRKDLDQWMQDVSRPV